MVLLLVFMQLTRNLFAIAKFLLISEALICTGLVEVMISASVRPTVVYVLLNCGQFLEFCLNSCWNTLFTTDVVWDIGFVLVSDQKAGCVLSLTILIWKSSTFRTVFQQDRDSQIVFDGCCRILKLSASLFGGVLNDKFWANWNVAGRVCVSRYFKNDVHSEAI